MAKRRRKKQSSDLEGFLIILLLAFVWKPIYESTQSVYTALFISLAIAFGIMFIFKIISMSIQTKKESRLKKSGIHEIDKMAGKEFERYLQQLFKSKGYKVQLTKDVGDYGADLVLEKDNKRIVVQAKRYKNNVGIKAVQEVIGAIKHYKAHEAWVVTNSNLTNNARNLANSNDIKLVERQELINLSLQLKQGAR